MALEGPKSIPMRSFSFLYGVSDQTNHNENAESGLQDELGKDSTIAFLHTCPCLLNHIDQWPVCLHLTIE